MGTIKESADQEKNAVLFRYPTRKTPSKASSVYFDDSIPAFVVSRYEDILFVLNNPEIFSSREALGPGLGACLSGIVNHLSVQELGYLSAPTTLVCADDPLHSSLRKPSARAFAAGAIRRMEPKMVAICEELLDEIKEDGQTINFVTQLAQPLVSRVMAEVFGVPEKDYEDFRRWTGDMVAISSKGEITSELMGKYLSSSKAFAAYIETRINELHQRSDGSILAKMLSSLEGDSALKLSHLLKVCHTIIVASHEPTCQMLTNLVVRLANDAPLQETIRANHIEGTTQFVDEMLRLESPVQKTFRTTTREVNVGGVPIPARSHVMLCNGVGNLDEHAFSEPDKLHLRSSSSERHLSFGYGRHFCIGAPLARTQACVVVRALLIRFRRMRCEQIKTGGAAALNCTPPALNFAFWH